MFRRPLLYVSLVLALAASQARGAIFCPDGRFTMPMQNALPWGAVGFLNNGCTATLIDSEHILAAAHCFAFTNGSGRWQPGPAGSGLRFYPNYHPDRLNPPWRAIDRVVVGSRIERDKFPPPAFPAMDWGIAHLDAPITDFPSIPLLPASSFPLSVTNAGYQRDPVIFGPGVEHYNLPPSPPEPNINPTCGNCWWQPALVVPDCQIVDVENHIVVADCSSQGGSSGSPFLWSQLTPAGAQFRIAGNVFGGSAPDYSASCEAFSVDRATIGPASESYQFAPLLSHGVALATRIVSGAFGVRRLTQLYSTDGDTDSVRFRQREGFTLTAPFKPFALDGAVPQPRAIAALNAPGGAYRLFVTTEAGELYTRQEGGSWEMTALPSSPTIDVGTSHSVVDVDTLYNVKGTDRVFITTASGAVFEKRFGPFRSSWAPPFTDASQYRRIAAVEQPNGRARVFLIDAGGDLFTSEEVHLKGGGLAWQTPQSFESTEGLPSLVDIDAAWTEQHDVRLFALDQSGGLWVRTMRAGTSRGLNAWIQALAFLHDTAPPENLVSLEAGHWREGPPGTVEPVLFATDGYGNIYYAMEHSLCKAAFSLCTPYWRWESFYHY